MGATSCSAKHPAVVDLAKTTCGPGQCDKLSMAPCCDHAPTLEWGQTAVQELRLLRASTEGDVKKVASLLEAGTFVDTRKRPAMRPRADDGSDYGPADNPGGGGNQEVLEMDAIGTFHKTKPKRKEAIQRGVGLTPLMCAAQEGHATVVKILLAAGASPQMQDEDGMTPLHFAASASCKDCCEALLAARALPEVRDDDGRDALACLPREALHSRAERQSWEDLLTSRSMKPEEDKRPAADPL
mmetsp:Transcript_112696/g.283355  ORF Transcript_112696/g.283355 Transcript_112696/m.283355 type:complete len:242 (+) Transcript_112696:84-809(+)